jgi:hypothetical protein
VLLAASATYAHAGNYKTRSTFPLCTKFYNGISSEREKRKAKKPQLAKSKQAELMPPNNSPGIFSFPLG